MNDLLALALLVVAVIAGSALCSGVEAALLTVNPVRVHELAARSQPFLILAYHSIVCLILADGARCLFRFRRSRRVTLF